MWAYIARRLLYNIPIFLGIVLFMMAALRFGGNPVSTFLGKNPRPGDLERMEAELGLDDHLMVQYVRFLGDVVTLSFDVESWDQKSRTVSELLAESVPPSIAITIPSLILTSLLSISIGLISAFYRGRAPDKILVFIAVLGMSISYLVYIILGQYMGAQLRNIGYKWFAIADYKPTLIEGFAFPIIGYIQSNIGTFFLVAISIGMLLALVGVGSAQTRAGRWGAVAFILSGLGLFGAIAWNQHQSTPVAEFSGSMRNWVECCALPVMINVTVALGYDTRYYRAVMVNESNQDYITTAVAKGASKPKIMFVHMLKNAMIPIVTRIMITLPFLITGSILLEVFFNIPGMGKTLITAINAKDFPVIQAFTAIFAALFIATNIITDVIYAMVDPRVRLQ